VRIQKEDGTQEEVRAKVVVDAVARARCFRTDSSCASGPVLNKGAVWTYWEGAYRDTGPTREPPW